MGLGRARGGVKRKFAREGGWRKKKDRERDLFRVGVLADAAMGGRQENNIRTQLLPPQLSEDALLGVLACLLCLLLRCVPSS